MRGDSFEGAIILAKCAAFAQAIPSSRPASKALGLRQCHDLRKPAETEREVAIPRDTVSRLPDFVNSRGAALRIPYRLHTVRRGPVKLFGRDLFDAREVRVFPAGFDESLQRLGPGQREAQILRVPGPLAR